MVSAGKSWLTAIALLLPLCLLPGPSASAQSFEFLPEVDIHERITHHIEVAFQAKQTREAGASTQGEIGPSVDFYLKPLVRLKEIAIFDLDDSKSRLLQLSVGYRYVPERDKPSTERMELVATSHFPIVAGILLSDRHREDLDWSNNKFTWRYRNLATVERRIAIGSSYHPAPYVAAEVYYQSQYAKWDTTALYAGCLLPIGKHFEITPYYEHQNVTGKRPNEQWNQFGLILGVHLKAREKM